MYNRETRMRDGIGRYSGVAIWSESRAQCETNTKLSVPPNFYHTSVDSTPSRPFFSVSFLTGQLSAQTHGRCAQAFLHNKQQNLPCRGTTLWNIPRHLPQAP